MTSREWIGLIPAGGKATRLGKMPCSKEITPITKSEEDGTIRVACSDLLESFSIAKIKQTFIILGHGKWDIPAFLGNGEKQNLNLAYLTIDNSPDVLTTLNTANQFVKGKNVAFGLPDILFEPLDAFSTLIEVQKIYEADIVLGVWPCDEPERFDMVVFGEYDDVEDIRIKKPDIGLEFAWIMAVWSPKITDLLNEMTISNFPEENTNSERHLGAVFIEAIKRGFTVKAAPFTAGRHLDIGVQSAFNTKHNF